MRTAVLCWPLLLATLAVAAPVPKSAPPPDFNRDVRPILSGNCFKCHGPDEKQRQANLRLDRPNRAVVVGKSGASELVRRIAAAGPLQMPPSHANKALTAAQKETLRRWVASGAKYDPHWAFVALPSVSPLPQKRVRNERGWGEGSGVRGIDSFIRAKLAANGLSSSPEADRRTLLRRASLDLTGLPPTQAEVASFVADKAPDAYTKVVDRLLASPRYGEKWARMWLDLARYADTNGYEKDRPRTIWPYRDWVIQALNADMPFDVFTIKQLAGDLLPGATHADRVATGFHRNTMLNEEGGIDPREYRFYAMVDRIATTGTTWLGLTVGCAQCHTHKFDPITQREYYRLMAFLDNADEPEIDVPDPEIAKQREAVRREIVRREEALPEVFPVETKIAWRKATPGEVASVSGATAEKLPDGSVRVGGTAAETDSYTVTLEGPSDDVSALRLEALTDASLGGNGPGRTPHGNFVLTEIAATVDGQPVKFVRAEADAVQEGFPASNAIDGKPKTGWAIQTPGATWNVDRTAIFHLEKPVTGKRWVVTLGQDYGGQHTLGRFRLSVGGVDEKSDPRPLAVRRKERRDAAFAAWKKATEAQAVRWTTLTPIAAKSNLPQLTILPDASVFSAGDQTKRDVYDLNFAKLPQGVTAIRLEAIPDDRLPRRGPGRVYYEGPLGDFHLSEVSVIAGGQSAKLAKATASFGNAAPTLDGNPQTNWSINGGQGKAHAAVFTLEKPLAVDAFRLSLLFEWYYPSGIGRFRVSVTTDPRAGQAALLPDIEEALTVPEPQRTASQNARLFAAFLRATPELSAEREAIEKRRREMPSFPTTLVFAERPPDNLRPTFVHHRGEFLQPKERVTAGVLSVLPGLPEGVPANRLTFARWLVSPANPLTARVAVNRAWAAFFGTGIVRTREDFGYQGAPPTHPELLDYLAWTFVHQDKWSMKKLHRRIVLSATYRQSSRVSPEMQAKDPENKLLARFPRTRLDAELLRDQALSVSGLLSGKIGGPSVFPPQPPGVTTEGTYGPLEWKVSTGEDRYRRGLYTFAKRTAPYAMFATFDAPSGEACLARREVSNTPLQALTLLNDAVFVEAAQALGKTIAGQSGTVERRAALLFARCTARPPASDELAALVVFWQAQKARFDKKELDPAIIAGPGDGDPTERAAWTTLARTLLNLDEVIVKR